MSQDAIAFEALTMRFADRVILDECTYVFSAPGITVLIGPSGSGKTTVLNLIAGYLQPSAGGLSKHGTIGYLLQEDTLLTKLTVAQNATVWARADQGRWSFDKQVELMHTVGLGDRQDQSVSELSGGERKRLQLALTMCRQPDFLLLDEPTASLDSENKRILAKLLLKLAENIGIIMTTHDIDFVGWLPGALQLRLLDGRISGAKRGLI